MWGDGHGLHLAQMLLGHLLRPLLLLEDVTGKQLRRCDCQCCGRCYNEEIIFSDADVAASERAPAASKRPQATGNGCATVSNGKHSAGGLWLRSFGAGAGKGVETFLWACVCGKLFFALRWLPDWGQRARRNMAWSRGRRRWHNGTGTGTGVILADRPSHQRQDSGWWWQRADCDSGFLNRGAA